MSSNAPVHPENSNSNCNILEEIVLPPENEIAFFNDNTEMTDQCEEESDLSPSPQRNNRSHTEVRKFDVVETLELPLPPKTVNIAKPSEDQSAKLWFDYRDNMDKTPVVSWEVKRYKLNKDGRWTFKSSKVYQEKESDMKEKRRMFHVTDISMFVQYRFTVSPSNVCGKGKESKSSNILYVEPPLPNGWFRTRQSPLVKSQSSGLSSKSMSSSSTILKASSQHRFTTSEAANPITNASSLEFIYYNLLTGQASLTRPDEDPYFIENSDVVNLFNEMEMKRLRDIYDEELLHFDKITKERFRFILFEVGERVSLRKIRNMFGEVSASQDFLMSYVEYMEVMYTFKMRSLSMSTIFAAAGTVFSCLGKSVQTYGHVRSVGQWAVLRSKLLDRRQYYNRVAKVKTCNMPHEIRFSLPEHDPLFIRAEEAFNPFEIEIIRLTFLHLDCGCSGEINMVELYRYFLVSCADKATLDNKILTPQMLKQRAKLFKVLTKKENISFSEFLELLLDLKQKDAKGFRKTKYSKLLSVFKDLSVFKATRSYLLSSLEKYLAAKKLKVYERGKVMLEAISGEVKEDTPPPPEEKPEEPKTPQFISPKKRRKMEREKRRMERENSAESLSDAGVKEKHEKCCFCGCREKDPDLPAMV